MSGKETAAENPLRLVYGYLRVPQGSHEQAAAWKQELATFCAAECYALSTVFIDTGTADNEEARPALAGLLDVLTLVGSYGVVIPSWRHLSAEPEELTVLRHKIARTCSKLIVMREVQQARVANAGSHATNS